MFDEILQFVGIGFGKRPSIFDGTSQSRPAPDHPNARVLGKGDTKV